eukprot:620308-Pyramimonas_sp.AAC.1
MVLSPGPSVADSTTSVACASPAQPSRCRALFHPPYSHFAHSHNVAIFPLGGRGRVAYRPRCGRRGADGDARQVGALGAVARFARRRADGEAGGIEGGGGGRARQ